MENEKNFGHALAKRQPEMKHVNSRGEFVESDAPDADYAVNMSDPDALNFIESIKAKGAIKPKETTVVHSIAATGHDDLESAVVSPEPADAEEDEVDFEDFEDSDKATDASDESDVEERSGNDSDVESNAVSVGAGGFEGESVNKSANEPDESSTSAGNKADIEETATTQDSSIDKALELETALAGIGIGKNVVNGLRAKGFDTIEKIELATNEALIEASHVTANNVQIIRDQIAAYVDGHSDDDQSGDGDDANGGGSGEGTGENQTETKVD